MSTIGRAVVRVPNTVKKGEVFKVQMVITHPMETGLRKDPKTGETIPAHYITKVEFYFGESKVATLLTGPGISANPYFSVGVKAEKSGTLVVKYEDNKGGKWEAKAEVNVT